MENVMDQPENVINDIDIDPEGKLPEEIREAVKSKIKKLNKNVNELSDKEKKEFTDEAVKEYLLRFNRKEKFKKGLLINGYKPGYTKPTLESRKQIRRKKNKQSRKSRRLNNK